MRAATNSGRRPLLVLGATVAAAALALTGCAAGQQAQTAGQTSVVDGTGFQAGNIDLRDVGVRAPSGASYAKGSTAFLEGVLINNGQADDQLVSVSSPDAASASFYPDGVTAVIGLGATSSESASSSESALPTDTAAPTDTASPTDSGAVSSTPAATPTGASTSASGSASSPGSASDAGPSTTISIASGRAVPIGYGTTDVQIALTGLTEDLAPAQTLQVTFTFARGGTVTATIAVKLVTDASHTAPSIDTGKEGN